MMRMTDDNVMRGAESHIHSFAIHLRGARRSTTPHTLCTWSTSMSPRRDAFASACSGAIGAVVALGITYPLAIVKTRLQAQNNKVKGSKVQSKVSDGTEKVSWQLNKPYLGSLDCVSRIIAEEGYYKLYVGIRAALLKAFATNFIFYFFHGLFRKFIQSRRISGGKTSKALWSMIHGILAGIGVQICILPIDMVVTRIQVNRNKKPKGFFHTMFGIIQEGGVLSLWKSLAPGLCLTLNPGITTASRTILEDYAARIPYNTSANFGIGILSKAVASIITYPYTVCKVRMQVSNQITSKIVDDGDKVEKHAHPSKRSTGDSCMTTIKDIYEENGIVGFYNGLLPQLLNAVLKEGILNMARLEIRNFVDTRIVAKIIR